jgi:hypothetical protein
MAITQRSCTTEISPETFKRHTSDTLALLKGVRRRILSRSLMKPSSHDSLITPEIRDLLSRILLRGAVVYDPDNKEHLAVYTRGIYQGQVERVRYHRGRLYETSGLSIAVQGRARRHSGR